ncbi:YcdB/YcdC domain-containing protein [Brevibacillus daliensis]|uniref:YcdB/YcdC domain-containing protein n=1 Tax=Brevibacillus daliensis TaxID=2892995 RepID=UPI001E3D6FBF|nr:YcdB/YcdC domain-containing protein [Brevibacillus daliensis]
MRSNEDKAQEEQLIDELKYFSKLEPRATMKNSFEALLSQRIEKKQRMKRRVNIMIKVGVSSSAAAVMAGVLLFPSPGMDGQIPGQVKTVAVQEAQQGKQQKNIELTSAAKETLDKIYKIFPVLQNKQLKLTTLFRDDGRYYLYFDEVINNEESKVAHITIDAQTGGLISYSGINPPEEFENIKPSEKIMKEKSTLFLQQLLGEDAKNFQVREINYEYQHASVHMSRYVNGLPVQGDSYVIGFYHNGDIQYVNGGGGYFKGISVNEYPVPIKTTVTEQVKERIMEQGKLIYSTEQGLLSYDIARSPEFFDANTGEKVWISQPEEVVTTENINPGGKKLTVASVDKLPTLLQDELKLNMKGATIAKSDLPPSMMIPNQAEYDIEVNGKNVYGVMIEKGEVKTVRVHSSALNETSVKISAQEAKKKAISIIEPYMEKTIKEVQLKVEEKPNSYSYYMEVLHNGILMTDQNYLIELDKQTGELVHFKKRHDTPTKALPNMVTPDQLAKLKLEAFKKKEMELVYVYPFENGKLQPKPVLVYRLINKR